MSETGGTRSERAGFTEIGLISIFTGAVAPLADFSSVIRWWGFTHVTPFALYLSSVYLVAGAATGVSRT